MVTSRPAEAQAPKVAKPGAPRSLVATAADKAIAVTWQAPVSDGGSSVTGYVVSVTPGTPTCTTTGVTHCLVSGLTDGKEYAVHVQAKNRSGVGAAATKSNIKPTTNQNCRYIGPSANLQRCDLADANLSNTNLADANLTDTHLAGAIMTGVSSGGVIGVPAALPTLWSLVHGYLLGPLADLAHAKLVGVSLLTANLTDADLAYSDLAGANLGNANLTDVRSGSIVGTPVALPSEWSVIGGYLVGPYDDLANADLNGLNLGRSTLTGVISGGITGRPVALPTDWMLVGGFLIGPDDALDFDDLSNLNLTGADLAGSALSYTNLSGTNFTNANLTGAGNLADADDATSIWSNTICPDGVNSSDSGDSCVTDA